MNLRENEETPKGFLFGISKKFKKLKGIPFEIQENSQNIQEIKDKSKGIPLEI